ncbi:MAG: DUF342 domain-containing protein [Nitrospirae bacterium]|nr:DUF342 domain-containing protein [Nitrospirota bacterium]
MNKKIPVSSLKEGMIIAEDIHLPETTIKEGKAVGKDEKGGAEFQSLIQAGVIVSAKLVELIKGHVEYVVIDARSVKVSLDETVISEEVKKNITVTGNLRISAKINPNIKIKAGNKITIEGNVPEGCSIESDTAEIMIKGNVIGTDKSIVRIKCPKNLSVHSFKFTEVTCGSTVRINNDAIDSKITAKDEVSVSGSVIRSKITTQASIKVNNCGSPTEKGLNELTIKSDNYEKLCMTFTSEASKTPEFMKNIKQSAENIDKVKTQTHKLMKSQEKIPNDKKKQLVELLEATEQKYQDSKEKLVLHQAKLTEIAQQLTNQLLQNKIIISGTLFPPALILIENTFLQWTKLDQKVTFYIHETDKKIKFKSAGAHY